MKNYDYNDLFLMRIRYLEEARKWEEYELASAAMPSCGESHDGTAQISDFLHAANVISGPHIHL